MAEVEVVMGGEEAEVIAMCRPMYYIYIFLKISSLFLGLFLQDEGENQERKKSGYP